MCRFSHGRRPSPPGALELLFNIGAVWLQPLWTMSAPSSASVQALLNDVATRIAAHDVDDGVRRLLQRRSGRVDHAARTRPFVTLSWAQSLDGSMANAPEASEERLMLSGSASMAMTHGLRGVHDAILVGRGTVTGDNPRLTVRLAADGSAVDVAAAQQPVAIVLDGAARTPPDCALLDQAAAGRRVIIVISAFRSDDTEKYERKEKLKERGAHILHVTSGEIPDDRSDGDDSSADEGKGKTIMDDTFVVGRFLARLMTEQGKDHVGDVNWLETHPAFKDRGGINSIFVEGGVSVVDAFLRRPDLVDEVVVTVAPVFVGGVGPASSPFAGGPARLRRVASLAVGDDVVVRGTFAADAPATEAADDRPTKRARADEARVL